MLLLKKDSTVAACYTIDSCLQCAKVISTANKVLGVIKRNYVYESQRKLMHLHKSLVRPLLEYCCQAWRTHLQKDIDNIEDVQRRTTRIIQVISSLSYEVGLYKYGILLFSNEQASLGLCISS